MRKLAKCGCGGKPILWTLYPVSDEWRVYCEKCFIETKSYVLKEKAIEVWNRAMGKRNKRIEA